jgi:hypothetical protein
LNVQFGTHFFVWSIQQGIMFQCGNGKIIPGMKLK